MGMWGVMVPLRSADLGLSELMISGFLLTIGLSLCAAIFLVTGLPALRDAGRLIRCAGPVYAFGFAVCLLTGSLPVFFMAGMVTGFAAGFLDTGLNGQSSQWEQQAKQRNMSSFHALFSLGMLMGAGLVTWLLSAGHDPKTGILVCALLYSIYIAATRTWLAAERLRDADPRKDERPRARVAAHRRRARVEEERDELGDEEAKFLDGHTR